MSISNFIKKHFAFNGLTVVFLFLMYILYEVISYQILLNEEREPMIGTLEFDQIPRVLAQVCMPDKTVSYDEITVDLHNQPIVKTGYAKKDSPEDHRIEDTVRLLRHGIRSSDIDAHLSSIGYGLMTKFFRNFNDGISHAYLNDTTKFDQPVFETVLGRPEKIVALRVATPFKTGNSEKDLRYEYWYRLPSDLSSDHFTKWQSAVAKTELPLPPNSTFSPWNYMAEGRKLPKYVPDHQSFKVRYRLITYQDYGVQDLFWRRTSNAAYDNYVKENGVPIDEQMQPVFIKKSDGELIEGC